MTTYNYLSEMQQLCFRAREALKVLKEKKLEILYSAAEEGFFARMDGMPVDEAEKLINQSQIEAYLEVKKFVEEKESEAAYQLREEQQEAQHA